MPLIFIMGGGMNQDQLNALMVTLGKYALDILGKIALFLLVIIIGFKIVKIIEDKMIKQMKFSLLNQSVLSFLKSFLRIGLRIVVIIVAVSSIGVETSTIVAVVGSAGLAVGLALQGSLSNLAAGVLIITNRPFAVGHYIEFGAHGGTVESIGLFYTTLQTPDGMSVSVPNSMITTTTVVNYSVYPTRRMDVDFSIAYESDYSKMEHVLMEIAKNHPMILADPIPIVTMTGMLDSGLGVRFRFRVKSEDYWPVRYEIFDKIWTELDRAGIEVPYNRLVVLDKSVIKESGKETTEGGSYDDEE